MSGSRDPSRCPECRGTRRAYLSDHARGCARHPEYLRGIADEQARIASSDERVAELDRVLRNVCRIVELPYEAAFHLAEVVPDLTDEQREWARRVVDRIESEEK